MLPLGNMDNPMHKTYADKSGEIVPEMAEGFEIFRKIYEEKARIGEMHLRTVKAAIIGDMSARFLNAETGRPPTKYLAKCQLAATSFELTWKEWEKVPLADKARVVDKLANAVKNAPEDVRRELAEAIWPEAFETKKKIKK